MTSLVERVLRPGFRILASAIPENRIGDRLYAFIRFAVKHKRLPTDQLIFNDVLYKIKTTDEILNPLRVFVSDKEYVKTYIKAVVGDRYNVPTIDVIRTAESVDNYDFPSDCCIKPTHASGKVILRKSGMPIDRTEIKSWFKINHYKGLREANYKTLQPKVIVEPLIFDDHSNDLDYKFFCLNGNAKLIIVNLDRFVDHTRVVFDTDWNAMDYSIGYPRSKTIPGRPDNLEEMLAVAQKLSAGFGFVRVDMYSNGKVCHVGEITNCHACACQQFIPLTAEREASRMIFG